MYMRTSVLVVVLVSLTLSWFVCSATIPDSLKHRIDSLKTLLNSPDVQERYAGEFGIAWELFDVDNPVAVHYARLAYRLALTMGDSNRIIHSGRIFGQLLRRVDELDSAVEVLGRVISYAERAENQAELAKMLNSLSVLYSYQGQVDKALIHSLNALKIRRDLNDSGAIAISLVNTGLAFYKMDNHAEALRYYDEALKFDIENKASLLTNMALARLAMGDSIGFIEHSREALVAAKPSTLDQTRMDWTFGYGFYYKEKHELDSAVKYYRACWLMAQRLHDKRMAIESRLGIAQCHQINQQYESALAVLDGLDKDLNNGRYLPLKLKYYDVISTAYEKTGSIKLALNYRNKHRVLNDSVVGLKMMNNAMMARLRFEEEQKVALLNKQSEIILLNEKVINRQRLLLLVTFLLGAVLLGFATMLYRFSQYQKGISADLDRKVFERTKDLHLSEMELVRRVGEQKILLELISTRMRSSVSTIRGLWNISMSRSFDRTAMEERFNNAVSDLLQVPRIVERATERRVIGDCSAEQFQPGNQLSLSLKVSTSL
jgi:tetratricopeptide (TPR) repeat protein